MPGSTAPRIGFASRASSPSAIARPGTPAIDDLAVLDARGPSAHSKCSAAVRRIFCAHRDRRLAWTALPATTAPRLAKVPAPQ